MLQPITSFSCHPPYKYTLFNNKALMGGLLALSSERHSLIDGIPVLPHPKNYTQAVRNFYLEIFKSNTPSRIIFTSSPSVINTAITSILGTGHNTGNEESNTRQESIVPITSSTGPEPESKLPSIDELLKRDSDLTPEQIKQREERRINSTKKHHEMERQAEIIKHLPQFAFTPLLGYGPLAYLPYFTANRIGLNGTPESRLAVLILLKSELDLIEQQLNTTHEYIDRNITVNNFLATAQSLHTFEPGTSDDQQTITLTKRLRDKARELSNKLLGTSSTDLAS